MKPIRSYTPTEGYSHLLRMGEYGIRKLDFGILNITAGSTYFDHTDDCLVALVTLGGKCNLSVGHNGNKANGVLGNRTDVFNGRASVAFIPHHTTYELITTSESIELVICRTPSKLDSAASILDILNIDDSSMNELEIRESNTLTDCRGEMISFYRFQHKDGCGIKHLKGPANESARIILKNNDLLCIPERTRAQLISSQGVCYQLNVSVLFPFN